jgi:hypothetical protein
MAGLLYNVHVPVLEVAVPLLDLPEVEVPQGGEQKPPWSPQHRLVHYSRNLFSLFYPD